MLAEIKEPLLLMCEHINGIMQRKFDETTALLRERFEGKEMPYGLENDGAWAWYTGYLQHRCHE